MSKPRIVDKLHGKITDRLYDVKVERVADEDEITVIGVNQDFPRDILSLTPQEFAGICREYLKENIVRGHYRIRNDRNFLNNYHTAWFTAEDLRFLAEKLDISGAFLNVNRNHWNFILSTNDRIFETYDPIMTRTRNDKRSFNTQNISVDDIVMSNNLMRQYSDEAKRRPKIIKKVSESVTIKSPNYTQKDFLIKHNYKMSDSFIDELGVIQHDVYNCGPYCLYAAKMSNEEPKVLS